MPKIVNVFLRDICGEFKPEELTKICSEVGEVRKEKISDIYSDYFVQLGMAPVRVLIGEETGNGITLTKYAKLTSFGAILLEFILNVQKNLETDELRKHTWNDFITLSGKKVKLDDLAEKEFERIYRLTKKNIVKPYEAVELKDRYRIIIEDVKRSDDEICSLLLNEDQNTPSTELKNAVLKQHATYSKNDGVFFSNISGYIYSEQYPEDVINILELARVQLLELRVYDLLIDKRIAKTYIFLEEVPEAKWFLGILPRGFRRLSRIAFDLGAIRVDLVDNIRDVMNSTKVTNDIFLAYLYRRVNEEFRIDEWYDSAKDRLNELDDVYSMVIDEVNMIRSYNLEFLIFALILIEAIIFIYTLR